MLIRPKHSKPARRKPAPTARADDPISHAPPTAQRLLDLQEQAGNRAVSRLVAGTVQRVPVSTPMHETLFNTQNASGQAVQGNPAGYGTVPTTVGNPGGANYDMTRAADDSGVTVLVTIRFLQQQRNSVAPPTPNPTNLPALGALLNSPTEIPANDPTNRRDWAAQAADAAANLWTGRHVLFTSTAHAQHDDPHDAGDGAGAGGQASAPADTPIRLPVTFRAKAVFGLTEPANHQIIVHPPSVVPGSPGQPIDAGNFYQQDPNNRSKSYPHGDDVIYAHEYGHLLGMPDEYSQSDEQLNAILHNAAPRSAASAQGAVERVALERMALAALSNPLYAALQAAMPSLGAALAAKRPLVTRKLADAARAGVRDGGVRGELEAELNAAAASDQQAEVPHIVAFETTENFSNLTSAEDSLADAFAPAALAKLVGDAYWRALLAPMGTPVSIPDFDDVSVNVTNSVYTSTGSGPLAAAANTEATGVAGPAGTPGLPPVVPSGTLIGRLSDLPATWAAAGSQLEAAVTPAAFSTAMTAALRSAAAAPAALAAVATLFGMAPPQIPNAAGVYRRAYTLVTNGARAAGVQVVNDLLTATMQPTLAASVTAVQSSIASEVTRILTTPPAGHAAAGPADPNMAAVVAAMKTRLDADKASGATTPRQDPSAGGAAVVPQNVTFSAQGLMGSSNSSAVRVDQFAPMVAAFNRDWQHRPREDPFTVTVGGGP